MPEVSSDPRGDLMAVCTLLAIGCGNRAVLCRLADLLPLTEAVGALWAAGVDLLDADVSGSALARERALIAMRRALRDLCEARLGREGAISAR